MDAYLKASNIGLDLPIYTQDQRGARAGLNVLLRAAFQPPKREMRRILSDVNFELHSGDRLAIIGRNGAGKSTLLKVLVGAYPPSTGAIETSGSCQALLNLSLGFNAEATLVENILLRGIAMGLKPRDASGIINEVLAFSELERKAGHRLRTLSSGQRMRLGFALATALQNDILIMDEWISAGDAAFVAKAKARIHSRVNGAQIVVLASHNSKLMRSVCNKGIVMEDGKVVAFGPVRKMLEKYNKIVLSTPSRPGDGGA
ncbi:ABC transporter ATP-binding protein [Luteimonas suaedae]|uniref:ABC transporter ATP-binding protein n=1 Tax=Luteimonas suaedae TaxID=2605430 RepID=UPI0011EEB2BA|nr:ABC transporter ATP-binding protein [Luteimonas suaedae]